jgi:hypothetical protein
MLKAIVFPNYKLKVFPKLYLKQYREKRKKKYDSTRESEGENVARERISVAKKGKTNGPRLISFIMHAFTTGIFTTLTIHPATKQRRYISN